MLRGGTARKMGRRNYTEQEEGIMKARYRTATIIAVLSVTPLYGCGGSGNFAPSGADAGTTRATGYRNVYGYIYGRGANVNSISSVVVTGPFNFSKRAQIKSTIINRLGGGAIKWEMADVPTGDSSRIYVATATDSGGTKARAAVNVPRNGSGWLEADPIRF
jgi:hypothetical protein